jgi:23S rRNA (cytidine1920-2'-O)/16S rRNA (cytidine1409-2'-O)-methyltransferase
LTRSRADRALVERGLAPSRTRAQELILAGRVTVNGVRLDKPSASVDAGATVLVSPNDDFVSRGGRKLAPALDVFGVVLEGRVVVDIGASTGGFTDVALRRGARKVYAVDVGHGQLDASLRRDARVVVREGTNARGLEPHDFDEPVDAVLVDASFIGLEKLTRAIARFLRPGGVLVALVKPQFQVGPEAARRTRGVVRDPEERERAVEGVRKALREHGFRIIAECDSTVPGPRGNVERFVHAVLEAGPLDPGSQVRG